MTALSIDEQQMFHAICAVALREAADDLDGAAGCGAFQAALGANHRLWLSVKQTAAVRHWTCPTPRDIEFALTVSQGRGRGADDAEIQSLIDINRRVAAALAAGAAESPAPWTEAAGRWLRGGAFCQSMPGDDLRLAGAY